MREPDFWTDCAEAMELALEGQRLIAADLADAARSGWAGAMRWLETVTRNAIGHRPSPRA